MPHSKALPLSLHAAAAHKDGTLRPCTRTALGRRRPPDRTADRIALTAAVRAAVRGGAHHHVKVERLAQRLEHDGELRNQRRTGRPHGNQTAAQRQRDGYGNGGV